MKMVIKPVVTMSTLPVTVTTTQKPHSPDNLLKTLLSRQIHPEKSPSILSKGYRSLIRKSYRKASGNSRKVFKTRVGGDGVGDGETNPVYDLAYSPGVYDGYRVLGVGDELGYLSVVKVGFEGGKGCGREAGGEEKVFHRGATSVATSTPPNANDSLENDENENPEMQPVLYSIAWNSGGDKILSGYGNGSIRVWDLGKSSRPSCVTTIDAFEKSLKRVAWCGETLISCSRTNEIFVHDQRMRKPLTNRIDCSLLNSKLTDISVLSDVYVVASSSNQSGVNLFDLRNTYKLYKRIKPVQSFDLHSPGYTTMKYDVNANDGMVYALGSDSIVRSFEYRTGACGPSYRVPGGVDFFTKIDVDRFSGVLVSGGSGVSAWGFDLFEKWEKGVVVDPFFELREGRKVDVDGGEGEESDKENERDDGGGGRSCSAVALGTRRGVWDCGVQMACGGDNSTVIAYD